MKNRSGFGSIYFGVPDLLKFKLIVFGIIWHLIY